MNHILKLPFAASLLGLTAVYSAPQPAHSAIICEGGYQIVNGVGAISTPYCQDKLLADLARKRGVKTDAETVRNNPSAKDDACYSVSGDIRVAATCTGFNGTGG